MSKFVPNSFQIANAFVDEAMHKLSDASVKIYLLIVRKTRGWTKESDALSLRQLEKLSKKSRPTVSKCLSELEEVGLIKKHHQSKYGNVYSPVDNYDLGEWLKFPHKKVMVKALIVFKKDMVKNFNHFGYGEKLDQNSVDFYLKVWGDKSILVKNFYHLNAVDNLPKWLNFFTTTNGKWLNIFTTGGKEFLPQVVKNFNPHKTTIKNNYQNKKNTWFVVETLKSEIVSIDNSFDTSEIFNASWFERELAAFEGFNQERNHSDVLMTKFFAEWMLKARVKYAKMKTHAKRFSENAATNTRSHSDSEQPQLSSKQVFNFANRLARHPEISGKYGEPGESYERLASRLALKLSDPEYVQKIMPYLEQVGFKQSKGRAA